MSRSPFIPAIIAFLCSSLFSFAASVLEGQWERSDGRALLQVRVDDQGKLQGKVTTSTAISTNKVSRIPLTLRQRLRRVLGRFSQTPAQRTIRDAAQPSARIGSVTVLDRSRILLRTTGGDSEWRRIS